MPLSRNQNQAGASLIGLIVFSAVFLIAIMGALGVLNFWNKEASLSSKKGELHNFIERRLSSMRTVIKLQTTPAFLRTYAAADSEEFNPILNSSLKTSAAKFKGAFGLTVVPQDGFLSEEIEIGGKTIILRYNVRIFKTDFNGTQTALVSSEVAYGSDRLNTVSYVELSLDGFVEDETRLKLGFKTIVSL